MIWMVRPNNPLTYRLFWRNLPRQQSFFGLHSEVAHVEISSL